MMTYQQMIAEAQPLVTEWLPWDLVDQIERRPDLMLLDIREPYEFDRMHIAGSINVPRGILETACEWDYEETLPELVRARARPIVLLCRSGSRSIMAARQMQRLGYAEVYSLRSGLRGWNDYEQPLQDRHGRPVDIDQADDYFMPRLRPEQLRPRPAP